MAQLLLLAGAAPSPPGADIIAVYVKADGILYTKDSVGVERAATALGGLTQTLIAANIQFPAAQVASADVNNLDDYEEGTFTPIIIGGTTAGVGTYEAQNGTYTKVGRAVHFRMYLSWSAHTGTGSMLPGGLPFVSSSAANTFTSVGLGYVTSIVLAASHILSGGYLNPNSTQITLTSGLVGGGAAAGVAMDPAGTFMLSGTYFV